MSQIRTTNKFKSRKNQNGDHTNNLTTDTQTKRKMSNYEENSFYMDCDSGTYNETYKSALSPDPSKRKALGLISTLSSSSSLNTMYLESKQELPILQFQDFKDNSSFLCESSLSTSKRYPWQSYCGRNKYNHKLNVEGAHQFSSPDPSYLSESSTYYNDPKIDTLDIFNPQKIGNSYFKAKMSTETNNYSMNDLDMTERIFLSTKGMTLSPNQFKRLHCKDFLATPLDENVPCGIGSRQCWTRYYTKNNRKTSNNIDAGKRQYESKQKTNVQIIKTRSKYFQWLVSAIGTLTEKERRIVSLYIENQEQPNDISFLKKQKTTSMIDELLNKYLIKNGCLFQQKKRMSKIQINPSASKQFRYSLSNQQCIKPKTSLIRRRFPRKKCAREKRIKSHKDVRIAYNKRNYNWNRIGTNKIQTNVREQLFNKFGSRKLLVKERDKDKKILQSRRNPIAGFYERASSLFNQRGPRSSPKTSSDLRHRYSSSEDFKSVTEICGGQFITHQNGCVSSDAKRNNLIPMPRNLISSKKKLFSVKQKDSFASTIDSIKDKLIRISAKTNKPSINPQKAPSGKSSNLSMKIKSIEFVERAKSTYAANEMLAVNRLSETVKDKNQHDIVKRIISQKKNNQYRTSSSNKIDAKSETADFRLASFLSKGRKYTDIKRKGSLCGMNDLSFLSDDQTMRKDNAQSRCRTGHDGNFQVGRRRHFQLDRKSSISSPNTNELPKTTTPSAFAKMMPIPRLNLLNSTIRQGNTGASLWKEEQARLKEESKSLNKEVQNHFYTSGKLKRNNEDILQSTMGGDRQKSSSKESILKRPDTRIMPEVGQEVIHSKISFQCGQFKHENFNLGRFTDKPKDNSIHVSSKETDASTVQEQMVGNHSKINVYAHDIDKNMCHFNKQTSLTNKERLKLPDCVFKEICKENTASPFLDDQNEFSTIAKQSAKPPIMNKAKVENERKKQKYVNCNVSQKQNQTLSSNRKVTSFSYKERFNLCISVPEILFYKPEKNSKENINDNQEKNVPIYKPVKTTIESRTQQRATSLNTEEPKPINTMRKLGFSKPRIWSSKQKRTCNLDSNKITKSHWLHPQEKEEQHNKHIVTLSEYQESSHSNCVPNSHQDSHTQSNQDPQRNNEKLNNSMCSKQIRPKIEPNKEVTFSNSYKLSKSSKKNDKSSKCRLSEQKTFEESSCSSPEFNKHVLSGSGSSIGEHNSFEPSIPKVYLQSAKTSLKSSLDASRIKKDVSYLSSSITSLSSSQFCEFIYPSKLQSKRSNAYGKGMKSNHNHATNKITNDNCNPWLPSDSIQNVIVNKCTANFNGKLKSDRKTDSINKNDRIVGWICGSNNNDIAVNNIGYSLQQKMGFTEQNYRFNEQYPSTIESIGNISLQPYRKSSSLPSRLVARLRPAGISNIKTEDRQDYTSRSSIPTENTPERRKYLNFNSIDRLNNNRPGQRSYTSISEQNCMQNYPCDNDASKPHFLSARGSNFNKDFNHAHIPSETKLYESEKRFGHFEVKVQNQISKRSLDTFDTHPDSYFTLINEQCYTKEDVERLHNLESDYEDQKGGGFKGRKRSTMRSKKREFLRVKDNPDYDFIVKRKASPLSKSKVHIKSGMSRPGTFITIGNKANVGESNTGTTIKAGRDAIRGDKTNAGESNSSEPTQRPLVSPAKSPISQSDYKSRAGSTDKKSHCDLGKICSGEQKMYAWPPMFIGVRNQNHAHRTLETVCSAHSMGSHASKADRLMSMMHSKQHRLNPRDIKNNDCCLKSQGNYIIKKFCGYTTDCHDVVKGARDDYLRNMQFVVKAPRGDGDEETLMEIPGTHFICDYHDNQDVQPSFSISLKPSPPRHMHGQYRNH